MGLGDYDDDRDDFDKFCDELDDYDYSNKRGLYAENRDEENLLECGLEDYGIDIDELELMDEDERHELLEDEGLDLDDYDDMYFDSYNSSTKVSTIKSNENNKQTFTSANSNSSSTGAMIWLIVIFLFVYGILSGSNRCKDSHCDSKKMSGSKYCEYHTDEKKNNDGDFRMNFKCLSPNCNYRAVDDSIYCYRHKDY